MANHVIFDKAIRIRKQIPFPCFCETKKIKGQTEKNGKFVANKLGKTKQNILITRCSMITMRDFITHKKYQLSSTFTPSLTFLKFQNYPKHSLTYQTNPNFRRLKKFHLFIAQQEISRFDGYPVEFFKHFWQFISPLFNIMVKGIKLSGLTPAHINTRLLLHYYQ